MKFLSRSTILYSIFGFTALLFCIFFLYPQQQFYYRHHVNINGTYLLHPLEIKNFTLTSTQGNYFTKQDFLGRWTLVFFGFTNCEMICPLTLDILNKTYQLLQVDLPQKKLPQVVIISIDPKRDNLGNLRKFVNKANPVFIGLSGDEREINNIRKQFHIEISKNLKSIDHTPDIVLVNPKAEIQAYFSFPQRPAQLVQDYKNIILKKSVT